MNPIQCTEIKCSAILVNPCGTVVALFAFKQALETRQQKKKIDNDEFDKHMKLYEESIKKTGIQEPEKMYEMYKKFMATPAAKKGTRHFVLQCVKGHVNTYQIDCD